MVEIDLAAPILLRMAVITGGVEVFAVRAGCPVATIAIGSQFLRGGVGGMAYVTIEFGVYSHQRKLCLAQMIVLDRPPHLVAVAIVALGAESPGVRILGLVAAKAVLRNLVLVDTASMASQAVDLGVLSEQRKTSFFLVIEFRGLPLAGGVTLAALGAALATMGIVGQVTTDAGLGPPL